MKAALPAMAMLMSAACATPETAPPADAGAARASDCVFHSTVSGFQTLDERRVVLFGIGRREAYLAEIAPGCFDLKQQSTLAAVDGDGNGQICGFGRDAIAYRQFGRTESCRILELERLSDERREALLGSGARKPAQGNSEGDGTDG